jgi:hypothetical protein
VSPANPTGPTICPAAVAQEPSHPLILPLHPLTGMAHASAASSLSSPILFPSPPRMRPHRATHVSAARAGYGTRAPPGWPARQGAGARTHANQTWLGKGLPLLPPHRASPHPGWCVWSRRHLGRPAGLSQGSLGLSPRRPRHRASKAGRGRNPSAQATNPHWGFPSYTSDHAVSEREQTHRRRVEPREGAVAPRRR